MSERRCWYETRAEEAKVPFVSIKNYGRNTIILIPELMDKCLYDKVGKRSTSIGVTTRLLEGICAECRNCNPIIQHEGQRGFRIFREGYKSVEANGPVAQYCEFGPDGNRQGFRIAWIDDNNMLNGLGEIFSSRGFMVFCAQINPNAPASDLVLREICRRICEWAPDLVISDKGLGYVDGVKLIQLFNEEGIPTVMFTGESQTDEIRRVAKYFLEKPVTTTELIKYVKSVLLRLGR